MKLLEELELKFKEKEKNYLLLLKEKTNSLYVIRDPELFSLEDVN